MGSLVVLVGSVLKIIILNIESIYSSSLDSSKKTLQILKFLNLKENKLKIFTRCLNLSELDGIDIDSWGKKSRGSRGLDSDSKISDSEKEKSRGIKTPRKKSPGKYEILKKEFEEFKQDIFQRFENLQESKPIEKTGILFEISDPEEYTAIKFAISKCINLFKANKYDSPSSSMKSFKEKWQEITIREKWNKKEDNK